MPRRRRVGIESHRYRQSLKKLPHLGPHKAPPQARPASRFGPVARTASKRSVGEGAGRVRRLVLALAPENGAEQGTRTHRADGPGIAISRDLEIVQSERAVTPSLRRGRDTREIAGAITASLALPLSPFRR